MAGKIVYYLGSLARMGLQRRKFLISDVQRLASLCLYNLLQHWLYARGDAESLPQFISLLSQVMATLFSKKMSNFKKKYISNVFVNKLHTNLKEAMARFYRL